MPYYCNKCSMRNKYLTKHIIHPRLFHAKELSDEGEEES